MKTLQTLSSRFLVTIFCLLIIRAAYAVQPPDVGPPPGVGPPSPAECDIDLIIAVDVMDFGTYVGGSSGTIVMDVNGNMLHSGLVPVGGTVGTPAIITLTPVGKNCEKHDVFFTMPTTISINNLSGTPTTTITITNLTNDLLTNPFQIRDLTAGQIKMGGTLTAASGDAQAPYSGTYNAIVTYQ